MKPFLAAAAIAGVAIAAPAGASAASLAVDPVWDCYRERQMVSLPGTGFTPNAMVDISRDGRSLGKLPADGVGSFQGNLALPGLARGRRRLTYVAKDQSNPEITAQVTVLVTATDVVVTPRRGAPNRRLRIRARGFFGGETVWAHIRREHGGRRRSLVRTVKVGRVKGACRRVKARKRLFRASTAPGTYSVQFDTFRRYRDKRRIEYDDLIVRIRAGLRSAAPVPVRR
jgi:hypothetical protein